MRLQSKGDDYFSAERLTKQHAIIYFAFICLIFVLFLVIEIVNKCKPDEAWRCCCCKRRGSSHPHAFSNNIYKDLGNYDLRSEYRKIKAEIELVQYMLDSHEIKTTPESARYLKMLDQKRQYIRILLKNKLEEVGV